MDKNRKVINIVFLAIIMAALLFGLVRTLIGPEDILEYENRKAARLIPFSTKAYLSGEFQDSVESAVSDQILGSSEAKQLYNAAKSSFITAALKPFASIAESGNEEDFAVVIDDESDIGGSKAEADTITKEAISTEPAIETSPAIQTETSPAIQTETAPAVSGGQKTEIPVKEKIETKGERGTANGGSYVGVGGGLFIYNDYVVQGVALFDSNKPRFDKYMDSFNYIAFNHPELNFYVYYIERDSDQNYASGYRNGIYEYLSANFDLPEGHIARQQISSFEEYKNYNMKSDHHWSYKGSYAGYCDIISMLKPYDNPLEPIDELKVGYTKGSFTKNEKTANFKDDFYAYEFDFPQMEVSVGGKPSTLGDEAKYIAAAREGKDNQYLLYGGFYGGDMGEVVLHNPSGSGSLLMFGNSYDNAVIKLLASHYEYTYSIDLRYYKNVTGKNFSFEDYVSNHQIDDVLAMGNAYYYLQAPFIIKP